MKNLVEISRRDFIKLAGVVAGSMALASCKRGVEGTVEQVTVIESGLIAGTERWVEIENPEIAERFKKAETESPVWADGQAALTETGITSIFSSTQVIDISSGFKNDQILLRTNYPNVKTLALETPNNGQSGKIKTDLDIHALRSLVDAFGGFSKNVSMLVDIDITVDGEILAGAVVGLPSVRKKLDAKLANNLVANMPIVGIHTPKDVLWQDNGQSGYYVRISDGYNDEGKFYRRQTQ